MATLIKIDRNGSKHYEGMVKCDRCGGDGIYKWGAMINGVPQYAGTCYKCLGAGKVMGKWIERTPEYQAKLDARREAKVKARQAEWEKQRAEVEARVEAEKKAEAERKAREQAEKAISRYVGEIGEKITFKAEYLGGAHFTVRAFAGYGEQTMFVHTFKDDAGNKLVWKTGKGLAFEEGQRVEVKGTIKDHSEYKDEKQTVLTRCKVVEEA